MSNTKSPTESQKPRRRQLTVRFNEREHDIVSRLVSTSGMSESALLRLAIQRGLPDVEKSLRELTGGVEVAS